MSFESLPYKTRALHAIYLVTFGFLGYSVADLCSKTLQEYYNIYQVLSVSSIFGLILSGTWLLMRHGVSSFCPQKPFLHFFRSLAVLGTGYFMVRSLHTLPLADFYGIVFLMPFLGIILSVIFLKERVGIHRWAAVAVGFAGVIVLAGPQFNTIGEGVICAALGALCGATNMILVRKIGYGAPLPLYSFYPFLTIFTFMSSAMVATDSYVPFRMEDLPMFLIHGPVVFLAITLTSLGFSKAPETAVVAPFQYTQAIWGVVFGWLFFNALPTPTTWTGLAIIISAGLYTVWREYKRKHPHA